MSTLTRSDAAPLPTLQALADEYRLRILDALREGERCVCVLQDLVGVSQSLLSHHLRVRSWIAAVEHSLAERLSTRCSVSSPGSPIG